MTHTDTRQIFGTTRWGRPSRFIADLPEDSVQHFATRARGAGTPRFIDREADVWRPHAPSSGTFAWRHPQAARASEPPALPGERFVDRDFFADAAHDEDDSSSPLRRGSRVLHARFGEGEVRRVENASEPAVVAFFPGWGEKKILVRFLKVH